MPFLTKEKFELVPGTEKIRVMSDLVYQIPDNFPVKEYRGLQVRVKGDPENGFISDLASFPKIILGMLFGLFRKLGKHRKPAVIHDWGYDTPGNWPKWIWDLIFLYAMIETLVHWFKRRTMYWAVKYGGYLSWRKHRKRDKHEEN